MAKKRATLRRNGREEGKKLFFFNGSYDFLAYFATSR